MKSHPVGTEMYADGQTDMTKPAVFFFLRNFANTLKMCVQNWDKTLATLPILHFYNPHYVQRNILNL